MALFRLRENDQSGFAEAPESAMDFHLGRSNRDEFYAVIGCRAGVLLNEKTFAEPESRCMGERWLLSPGIPAEVREAMCSKAQERARLRDEGYALITAQNAAKAAERDQAKPAR